jgi:hypothetical protein
MRCRFFVFFFSFICRLPTHAPTRIDFYQNTTTTPSNSSDPNDSTAIQAPNTGNSTTTPINNSSTPENVERRGNVTRDECVEQGGNVVGDIGDGAIFEEAYVCESSGLPPLANIVQDANNGTTAPIAIEGEVCCGVATAANASSPATDSVTIVDDIEPQEDVGDEKTAGSDGDAIEIFGLEGGGGADEVVSYQEEEEGAVSYQKAADEGEEAKDGDDP